MADPYRAARQFERMLLRDVKAKPGSSPKPPLLVCVIKYDREARTVKYEFPGRDCAPIAQEE